MISWSKSCFVWVTSDNVHSASKSFSFNLPNVYRTNFRLNGPTPLLLFLTCDTMHSTGSDRFPPMPIARVTSSLMTSLWGRYVSIYMDMNFAAVAAAMVGTKQQGASSVFWQPIWVDWDCTIWQWRITSHGVKMTDHRNSGAPGGMKMQEMKMLGLKMTDIYYITYFVFTVTAKVLKVKSWAYRSHRRT